MADKTKIGEAHVKKLNVENEFNIAGVQVTPDAAELNKLDGVAAGLSAAELSILDGVTATAAEINKLAGVTAGTATASKAAVLGANKNLDVLAVADGGLALGAGAGTAITATAAELNLIDGSIAGTAVASKAAVLGANKNLDMLAIADGGLALGTGAGTAITATAAEINKLDGAPLAATFVVGADAGTTINVAIQLQDGNTADIAVRGSVLAYLSDDANGDSIAGTAPSGGWAIGTDGLLIPVVAGKAAQLVSESDGDIDVTITEAGTATWYLVLVLPNGKLAVSGAITFAA